ncbi:MAG: ribose 5-phosphate isomerase B [Clostridia bacterium]|nr:ribose 5-phosphate isomerase B [Clostridia bacterium]
MKVSIATDHAGLEIKNELKTRLEKAGYTVVDYGTHTKDSCDYPDYALPACEAVVDGTVDKGILVCMTGIGMSVAANKVKGVRAALVRDKETAKLTREHNDSNVLVISGLFTPIDEAEEICSIWLSTAFSEEERHARRIRKISEIENKYCK